MRLVAVFIKGHYLFEEDQIINFGGKYIYDFKTNENNIEISRKKNEQFIEDFFGNDISLASAIVGGNGSGKTSLVHTILINYNRQNYGIFDCDAIVFIFEDNNSIKIFERHYGNTNFSTESIDFQFSNLNKKELNTVFYTPILDIREFYLDNTASRFFDLSKYRFFQNDTEDDDGSFTALSEFHLSENLKRWIVFRNHFQSDFDSNFVNIPKFDSIKIKINRVFSLRNKNIDQISEGFRPFMEEFDKKWQNEYHNNSTNRRKLELNIILSVIEKVFKILEETGNTYLEEGRVHIKLNDIESLNLEESFYLFLDNHYFIEEGNLEEVITDVRLPVLEIKKLIKILLENLPNENEIKKNHWAEYEVDFDTSAKIDITYREFIRAFSHNFTYDKTILLTFKPNIDLSSGEKGLLDLFSTFYSIKDELKTKDILIFFDEGDATFHPEWKIKYVNSIVKIFPEIFKGKNIQIIFTTHDPLTLSDIPDSNIVYLKNRKVLSEIEKPKNTFGANITDLLSESFFLEDGLVGDFAREKISISLEWLKRKANEKRKKNNIKELFEINEEIKQPEFKNEVDKIEYHKKVIRLVDEPIVKQKLKEMFIEFVDEDTDFKEEQIRELEEKLNKLKGL